MQIDLNSTIVRLDNAMSTPLDEELVILNMAKNNYIALNDIGRRIWELIESPIRVEDLNELLSREFQATPEQIAADVLPFLNNLEDEGLVHVTVGGP
jgi:hypothetical protein